MQPLTARYRALLSALSNEHARFNAGQDRLTSVRECLLAVTTFLDAEPVEIGSMNFRLLGMLNIALRDLAEGGKPSLLSPTRATAHRPPNQSFGAFQGTCAAATTVLMEAGESRERAARFVASLIKKYGIRDTKNRSIGFQQILRWRDEMGGGRASGLASKNYTDALIKWERIRSPDGRFDLLRCRLVAEGGIWGAASEDSEKGGSYYKTHPVTAFRTHRNPSVLAGKMTMNTPKPPPEPLAVSILDACSIVGLSRTELYRLIGAGRIRALKHGTRTLIPMDSLRVHLASLPPADIRTAA